MSKTLEIRPKAGWLVRIGLRHTGSLHPHTHTHATAISHVEGIHHFLKFNNLIFLMIIESVKQLKEYLNILKTELDSQLD